MSLVLNKKSNELARASVSKLSTHLEMLGEPRRSAAAAPTQPETTW